jgi:hypothetical protein
MTQALIVFGSLFLAFAGGFAVGWGERRKQEIRENARRFERLRDAGALRAVREHFAGMCD